MTEHGAASSSDAGAIDELNAMLRAYICRDSLFVAWHYSCGSRWDTPFWRYASEGIARARASKWARGHVAAMAEFIEAGRSLPGSAISAYDDEEHWEADIYPLLSIYSPFGNFSELNFAQVGHGIGYYDHCLDANHAGVVGHRR
jgi:hypothetical protein